jgi:di/tricarboxylate transporter
MASEWYDMMRVLNDEDDESPVIWQMVLVGVTMGVMFLFMLKDWIGPDWVMVTGLIVFMVTGIIDSKEALQGFSNEGILTVMSLFVMAEGVTRTGLLDYYMGLVLGKPKTVAGAQLRLMLPIAFLSAFLNNTPIVAVAIPLTLRWAKTIQVPRQQLLIPLSYATILGGTCTLVGTSTNLVVSGKLSEDFPDQDAGNIGLFDLALYGVPNALFGIIFMLSCSSFLLPGGRPDETSPAEADDLLLGAQVMPWSPSAGRTVKRSGLSDAGGIYLVNVKRYATGNLQYAVSRDFVLSVGDELYFTGRVEQFSTFCEKHGLLIITTDHSHHYTSSKNKKSSINDNDNDHNDTMAPVHWDAGDGQVGSSHVSTFQTDETERLRIINRLMDQIADRVTYENESRATRVIITSDAFHTDTTDHSNASRAIIVAVDTIDRPGLMLQISDTLLKQGLQVRHSEAKVVQDRSLSIWRCTAMDKNLHLDFESIWESMHRQIRANDHHPLLHDDDALATKRIGVQVIRATVTRTSSLIGKKAGDVHFREVYKAAIVAYQKNGKNTSVDVPFDAGDLLVMKAYEGSPLLEKPLPDFYKQLDRGASSKGSRRSSARSIVVASNKENSSNGLAIVADPSADTAAWKDLKVAFPDDTDHERSPLREAPVGEFLTAFVIAPTFPIKGRTVVSLGYARLPGVVLVSVERPTSEGGADDEKMAAVSFEEPLQKGDILWYSGSAEAIGEMKRVHGLSLYQEQTIQKETTSLQDRRLIQAVVARSSPLVGLSIKEARFRTEYGGVVIAVQRGSDRIREHPAKIVLQTGDVLLVEAGPGFASKHAKRYGTFALVSEVENSAPPRPKLFLLCVAMIVASLAVAALEIRSLLVTSTMVGIVMTALGVLTQQEARNAIQWDLYIVVASAFGVGAAMVNSGVAEGLATIIVTIGTMMNIGGK